MKQIILFIVLFTFSLSANAQKKKKSVVKKTIVKKVNVQKIPANFKQFGNGILINKVVNGKGDYNPKLGDFLTFHIRAYVSDSMLFDSYKLNNNEPVPAQVLAPQFNGDIMEIFPSLVQGDSVVLLVHQDSIFRNGMTPPFAKKGDLVIYQIKLESVKQKSVYEAEQKMLMEQAIEVDEKAIKEYITKNKLENVIRTSSGLYYQKVNSSGAGLTAPIGKDVTMNYTGYLLNGEVFDSNVDPKFSHVTPFTFKLGKGLVIKGWDEGVALMKKGDKFKLLIPSVLAYGPQGRPGIPSSSVLIFDVELVDF